MADASPGAVRLSGFFTKIYRLIFALLFLLNFQSQALELHEPSQK